MKTVIKNYGVKGYKTNVDFDNYDSEIISDYGLTKKMAMSIAKEEIECGKWYAVKYQSECREDIEILYKK